MIKSQFVISIFIVTTLSAQEPTPQPSPQTQVSQKIEALPAGTQSVILTRMAEVWNQPSDSALVILQLKQGDNVEVLEQWTGFYKIKFKIEGDFPVEGYIREGAILRPDAAKANQPGVSAKEQNYEADLKREPVTEVPTLPSQPMKEAPRPEIQARSPLKDEDLSIAIAKPLKRRAGPWKFEGRGGIGFQTFSESLTTKVEATNEYASDPFLVYEVNGAQFSFNGKSGYQIKKDFEAGLSLQYDFTIYRGTVATETARFSPNIQRSNVQALMHEIQMGPYAQYKFTINSKYSIIPEVRLLGVYNVFTTNQLESKDNLSPGVDGQIVLFNTTMLQFLGRLGVTLTMPYELSMSPYISAGLFTNFAESPVTTLDADGAALPESETIRTGKPNGGSMQLNYGAHLAWNLRKFGLETINVLAFFNVRDLSRSYSGQGNRAGMKMIDTKASSSVLNYGLAVDYLF